MEGLQAGAGDVGRRRQPRELRPSSRAVTASGAGPERGLGCGWNAGEQPAFRAVPVPL